MGEQMPIKWLRFEKAIQELVEAGMNFSSLDQVKYTQNFTILVLLQTHRVESVCKQFRICHLSWLLTKFGINIKVHSSAKCHL